MKTQLFEPFAQLFHIPISTNRHTLAFRSPGTHIKFFKTKLLATDKIEMIPFYPCCTEAGKAVPGTSNIFLFPDSGITGTIIAHVSNKNHYWPKREEFTKKLFKAFECNTFLLPFSWEVTTEYYYGLGFLLNSHKALLLIPLTLLNGEIVKIL